MSSTSTTTTSPLFPLISLNDSATEVCYTTEDLQVEKRDLAFLMNLGFFHAGGFFLSTMCFLCMAIVMKSSKLWRSPTFFLLLLSIIGGAASTLMAIIAHQQSLLKDPKAVIRIFTTGKMNASLLLLGLVPILADTTMIFRIMLFYPREDPKLFKRGLMIIAIPVLMKFGRLGLQILTRIQSVEMWQVGNISCPLSWHWSWVLNTIDTATCTGFICWKLRQMSLRADSQGGKSQRKSRIQRFLRTALWTSAAAAIVPLSFSITMIILLFTNSASIPTRSYIVHLYGWSIIVAACFSSFWPEIQASHVKKGEGTTPRFVIGFDLDLHRDLHESDETLPQSPTTPLSSGYYGDKRHLALSHQRAEDNFERPHGENSLRIRTMGREERLRSAGDPLIMNMRQTSTWTDNYDTKPSYALQRYRQVERSSGPLIAATTTRTDCPSATGGGFELQRFDGESKVDIGGGKDRRGFYPQGTPTFRSERTRPYSTVSAGGDEFTLHLAPTASGIHFESDMSDFSILYPRAPSASTHTSHSHFSPHASAGPDAAMNSRWEHGDGQRGESLGSSPTVRNEGRPTSQIGPVSTLATISKHQRRLSQQRVSPSSLISRPSLPRGYSESGTVVDSSDGTPSKDKPIKRNSCHGVPAATPTHGSASLSDSGHSIGEVKACRRVSLRLQSPPSSVPPAGRAAGVVVLSPTCSIHNNNNTNNNRLPSDTGVVDTPSAAVPPQSGRSAEGESQQIHTMPQEDLTVTSYIPSSVHSHGECALHTRHATDGDSSPYTNLPLVRRRAESHSPRTEIFDPFELVPRIAKQNDTKNKIGTVVVAAIAVAAPRSVPLTSEAATSSLPPPQIGTTLLRPSPAKVIQTARRVRSLRATTSPVLHQPGHSHDQTYQQQQQRQLRLQQRHHHHHQSFFTAHAQRRRRPSESASVSGSSSQQLQQPTLFFPLHSNVSPQTQTQTQSQTETLNLMEKKKLNNNKECVTSTSSSNSSSVPIPIPLWLNIGSKGCGESDFASASGAVSGGGGVGVGAGVGGVGGVGVGGVGVVGIKRSSGRMGSSSGPGSGTTNVLSGMGGTGTSTSSGVGGGTTGRITRPTSAARPTSGVSTTHSIEGIRLVTETVVRVE